MYNSTKYGTIELMETLIFASGVIIGLMMREIKSSIEEEIEVFKTQDKGKTQFLEPVDTQESFKQSTDIDEFLKKLQ